MVSEKGWVKIGDINKQVNEEKLKEKNIIESQKVIIYQIFNSSD